MSFEKSIVVFLMSIYGENPSAEVILITTLIISVILLGLYQLFLKTFLNVNITEPRIQIEQELNNVIQADGNNVEEEVELYEEGGGDLIHPDVEQPTPRPLHADIKQRSYLTKTTVSFF